MKKTIYYYTNESDPVINFNIKTISIDDNYTYKNKNIFYKAFSWFTYWLIAKPIAFAYFKLLKQVKFKNTKILKQNKNGCFIYANHTQQFCDCFCPALICLNKKPHIIVNPDNVSLPFWGQLLKMWGAIPTPNTLTATKNFYTTIEQTIKNNPIIIYPEKNLWPYYTKIRNFDTSSFRYPVKYNLPVYTFTTVYRKKKLSKKPKIEIYVDGPFYVDNTKTDKENQQLLKNKVFSSLEKHSGLSNYEFVKYIKRSSND